jgi:hypothetical protein
MLTRLAESDVKATHAMALSGQRAGVGPAPTTQSLDGFPVSQHQHGSQPGMERPLSGRLSLPHYLYWFSLQPTDAKGRLWRGRRQETPRPKVRTSGDVAQPRPLTSHSEAGRHFLARLPQHTRAPNRLYRGRCDFLCSPVHFPRDRGTCCYLWQSPMGDRAEFSRMVPEKIEAFSTADMVMLKQSGQASRQ